MNDAQLVADWISKNGAPRRFAPGVSANPSALRFFLEDRGYETGYSGLKGGGKCLVKKHGARGPARRMDANGLIAFVDQHRVAEGLEPIIARGADE